jgi:signal transduction histidine kinase
MARVTPNTLSDKSARTTRTLMHWKVPVSRSTLLHYAVAVVSICLATVIRDLLDPVLHDRITFTMFFPAVIVAAWIGGLGPALLALALGALSAAYFFLPASHSFALLHAADVVELVVYATAGLTIALISETQCRAQCRAQALARENAELYEQTQEALQARDLFFSSVSHDLRSPLTSIKGFSQLARRRLAGQAVPAVASVIQGLDEIDGATTKMNRMIDQLLDLSRLQAGQALALEEEPMDLIPVVRECAAEYQQTTQRHRIDVQARVDQLEGLWDRRRIERVVDNLLSNAIKFTPSGGVIRISMALEESGAGNWAMLAVQDEGVGIPETDLPALFNRFYRASNVRGRISGTGIGLAGARQIVEEHGGRISVVSSEGHGSTFTVRLPLCSPGHARSTLASA